MPREQINFPKTNAMMIDNHGHELELLPGADIPVGAKVLYDPAIHVSWQPQSSDVGGHVQVFLEMESYYLKHRAAMLDEKTNHGYIYTPVLSRQELNKLIRVLRVARDKAYGRDE